MKKLTLLTGIAIISGLVGVLPKASAQITIDQSDLPSAGLKVVTEKDSTLNLPVPGSASSSPQSWDFSNLVKQKAATIEFMTPGSTPYSSAFPSANLADSTYGVSGYNYLVSNPAYFSVEGAEEIVTADSINFLIELNLSPLFEQTALPATYNSVVPPGLATGSETFNKTFSVVVTKEQFTDSISYSDTVDAFGTLKMPNGKTYDVLREKHNEVDYEDVYLYIFSTWTSYERIVTKKYQYDWYAKGVGYILAEMDMDSTSSTVKDVVWDTTAPAPLGINEISTKSNVNVYPNPANTEVTFNIYASAANGGKYITIYDITGRQLEQAEVKNRVAVVNTESYSNGVYLYSLTDNSGTLLDHGKFIIQH